MPTLLESSPDSSTLHGEQHSFATSGAVAAAWRAYHQTGRRTPGPEGDASPGVAEHEFIARHLPLVKTVVGRMRIYLPPHLDAEDLHSVGLAGLMSAVRKYNPAHGATFHGYAMLCIRGAVLDELRRMDWMPRGLRTKAKQLRDTLADLENARGRAVTEEEAATALGMGLDEYRALLDEVRPISFVPIDAGADGDDESCDLHETIADDSQPLPGEALERRELLAVVTDHIQKLPDMQRKVLALYYHEGMRLSEIAAVFDVTESRISQIHTQAIISLRAFVRRAMEQ